MITRSGRAIRHAIILAALTIAPGPVVIAQSLICARTRPLESCRAWIVTEVGGEFPLGSTGGKFPGSSGDIDNHIAVTYGLMKNLKTAAVGITGSAMTTGAKSGARGEIRFRSRNPSGVGLQATGGIVQWAVPGTISNRAEPASGLTGSIGLDRGWFGVDARLDLLRTADRQVSAVSVGAHLGEKPAQMIMAMALALGVLLFFNPPD